MVNETGKCPSQAAVGRELGLSAPSMTKLKKLGMPVDSAESALAWRLANLNIAQRKAELPLSGTPLVVPACDSGLYADGAAGPSVEVEDTSQCHSAAMTSNAKPPLPPPLPDSPADTPSAVQPPLIDLANQTPLLPSQPVTATKDAAPDKNTPEPTRFSAFDEARTRREVADANLSELKEAELRGQVIRADAMRSAWAAKVATVRDALLQIPSRLAPVLAAETDLIVVTAKLETELRQALSELSTTK